jgi:glutamyl-tRNA synthetase
MTSLAASSVNGTSNHPPTPIRTRFAPSPTGYLHVGGARTALYAWAFARHFGGVFILRVEDTDLERSTPAAVQAILDGMQWLGLQHDEGPFYQMQRLDHYRAALTRLLEAGHAYPCYSTPDEVEAMRERQRATGDKPRYDGTWRPEPGKILPAIPAQRLPVIRFRNPVDGVVTWNDLVKGTITIANKEMDDLVIARPDGTPTYNFCVAVDDWGMRITHVIRGDDHVNNTPRQINILQALGAPLPHYAHLPMILGNDGEKLSKRHGAVSVMDYPAQGFLPEAMINYLARLGWSHGDDEIFSAAQMCRWFNLDHLSKSPAQFDPEKLAWLNAHYIKHADDTRLAELIRPLMLTYGAQLSAGLSLESVVALMKERASTINELATAAMLFYQSPQPDPALIQQHITPTILPALNDFAQRCIDIIWNREALAAMLKDVLKHHQLKMPQLAMPLRLLLTGQLQTPAIDAVVALFGREVVLKRLNQHQEK